MRLSVLSLVLFTAEQAFAQEPERRGFIGIGIGPSTPVGSYAKPSWANTRTDGTAPGYTDTFVNVGYRMRQHWGVAGAFSYSEYVMTGDGDDDQGNGLGLDLRAAVRYDVLRRWAVFAEGGIQSSNVSFRSGDRTGYRAVISGIGIAFRPTW